MDWVLDQYNKGTIAKVKQGRKKKGYKQEE